MNTYGLGDLAQTFLLQRRGAALKTEMTRLNEELASGKVSDVKSVLAGNVSYLSDIEGDLRTLSAYKVSTTEAAQFTASAQNALERMDTSASMLSTQLLTVSSSAVGPVLDQMSVDATNEFRALVSALNTSTAGRTLFSGSASDRPAVADADAILADIRTAVAGSTSIDDIMTALDNWFNDPAGYQTVAYTGSVTSIAPFQISDDEQLTVDLRADQTVFKNLLKSTALAAIAADQGLGLSPQRQQDVLETAGTRLLEAKAQLTATRSNLGSVEARIETIATRNATRATSLEFAKGALLEADPYDTATQLEAVQFQLQSLYTITARMSDLNLVNYVR